MANDHSSSNTNPTFFLLKQFWNKCEIILVINRIQAMKVIHIHLIFPPSPLFHSNLCCLKAGWVGPDPRILWFGNHCDYNFVIKHCQMRKLIHIHPSPSALAAPPSLTLTSVCSPTNLIESYFLFSILKIFSSSHFSVFIFKSFICSHLLLSTLRYPTKNFLLSSVAGNGHHPTIINISSYIFQISYFSILIFRSSFIFFPASYFLLSSVAGSGRHPAWKRHCWGRSGQLRAGTSEQH